MLYELTEYQKHTIDEYAAAYWADFKVRVEGSCVVLYVDAWQGEIARQEWDYFPQPHKVVEAILEYHGYKNRSKVSAKNIIQSQYLALRRELGPCP